MEYIRCIEITVMTITLFNELFFFFFFFCEMPSVTKKERNSQTD